MPHGVTVLTVLTVVTKTLRFSDKISPRAQPERKIRPRPVEWARQADPRGPDAASSFTYCSFYGAVSNRDNRHQKEGHLASDGL